MMPVAPSHGSATKLPSWRLVAAAFLHFGIIAYLILIVPLCLLLASADGGVAGLIGLGLELSGIFVAAFMLLGGGAVAVAAMVDRRTCRRACGLSSSDSGLSRERVATAMTIADGQLDPASLAMLASILTRRWDHDDHRHQALARDLDRVVRAAVAALAVGSSAQANEIQAQTSASLELIDQALADLTDECATVAASTMHTTALYIQRRYGRDDFAIKPD